MNTSIWNLDRLYHGDLYLRSGYTTVDERCEQVLFDAQYDGSGSCPLVAKDGVHGLQASLWRIIIENEDKKRKIRGRYETTGGVLD